MLRGISDTGDALGTSVTGDGRGGGVAWCFLSSQNNNSVKCEYTDNVILGYRSEVMIIFIRLSLQLLLI